MPFVAKRIFDYDPVTITSEWGLRDVQTGVAYMVCYSLQCVDCETLFLDRRFDDDEMARLYANYRDDVYNRLRISFEPEFRTVSQVYEKRADYVRDVEAFLSPYLPAAPAVLDWGGDTGINTPLLERASTVHIYDISNKPVIGKAEKVDLETASRNRYDIVTCSQVLEHVSYPQEIVDQLGALMQRDSLLYLEVPHEALIRAHSGSTNAHRYKRHWHEHINFFSEKSLNAMIARAGLQPVVVQSIGITFGGKPANILAALCRRP
jgi:hypothetical protein